MSHVQPSITLSIRITPQVREGLEDLAEATGHTKSFHAAEAIQEYLKIHAWQVKALQKSIKRADSKSAKFIEHKKVVKWLATWGSHEEEDAPE